jgi:hypothetical protein
MCLVENDPPERSPGTATTPIPDTAGKATVDDTLPGLEEWFTDPVAQRRVGELISRAARRATSKP